MCVLFTSYACVYVKIPFSSINSNKDPFMGLTINHRPMVPRINNVYAKYEHGFICSRGYPIPPCTFSRLAKFVSLNLYRSRQWRYNQITRYVITGIVCNVRDSGTQPPVCQTTRDPWDRQLNELVCSHRCWSTTFSPMTKLCWPRCDIAMIRI